MRLKTKGMRKRIGVLFMLFVLSITMMCGTQTAFAAEYIAYDNTDIESDLADIDTSAYPKDESARHRLLDDVGFMEYAYSDSVFIADNYYGLYFYVYNPTEKPVSLTSGAHHVNMATAYDENGEPSDYNNCEITFLDATANNRFLKFKLTDSRAAYDTAVSYAGKHDGVRRYDIASIQLLFQGDDQATDSFTGVDSQEGISFTYYCTGYSAGCGADPEAESTLDIQYKKLDTIGLDIQSTWYRTDRIDGEMRYTLSSVYFAVADRYITDYGALQIVKAEWYEYKTTPILVTDNQTILSGLTPYLGHTLPKVDNPDGYAWTEYYDESIPVSFYQYIGPSDSGQQGFGWNRKRLTDPIARYDWLIEVDDITATVPSAKVQDWAENYPIRAGDDVLTVGGRDYNANLFSDEVDDGHTRGYNQRVFDARDEEQWIDLKTINQTSSWDRFWNQFLPAGSRDEDWVIEEDIKPIVEVTPKMVNAADDIVAQEVLIDETQVSDLRNYVTKADEEGKTTYMLRFSLSEYNAATVEYHDGGVHLSFPEFYAATDTVYLSFDIIYLGFVKNDIVTIIPVVADPVDVYPSLDPTEDLENKGIPWWAYVILVVGELVVLLVLRLILCKLCNLPTWVWLIILAVAVVLNIFFIRTWAAWIASLLDPYLGWLPFS